MQIIVDADSRRLSLGPTPPVRGETIPGTLTFMKGGVPFRLPAGTAIQIGVKSWNDPSDVLLAYTTATRPEPDGAPYTFSLSLNTSEMLAKFTAGVTRYDCSIEVKWEVSAGSGTFKKTQRHKYSVDADTVRDTDANPSTMLSRNDFLVTNGTGLLVNVAAGYAANGAFVAAQASLAITNATNYIEVTAAGVASVNTTAFSAGSYPLATVVASAGAITSNTDLRAWITPKPAAAGGVTSITGTANEITVTGTTTPTLSLPSALTFTAKTITGGTFASPTFTTPTIGDGTESAPSLSFTSDTNTGLYRPTADTVGIVGGGHDILRLTDVASAADYLEVKNGIGVGTPLHVLAEGASANIGVHLQPKGSGLFTISDGTDFNKGIRFRSSSSAASAITLLDAVSTAGRVVTLPDATGTLATLAGTETFTNKRITPRTGTATSSATPTINTDNVDRYDLTAQAEAITSFTTNLSGTPTNGQALWISVKGTAARAITWGASFESGAATLPTTTVSTDRLDVLFVWNAVTSKWRCVLTTATPASDATKLPLAGGTMDENAIVNLFNGSKWQQSTPNKGAAGDAGFSVICSVGYEYKFALGYLFILSDNSTTVRKVLYAPATPTATDDTTLGFTTDTTWEMADGTLYECTDATATAAVWEVVPAFDPAAPGSLGDTTPDVVNTTGLNVKDSGGTTTASINGSDGSASFANGALVIDQYGNLTSLSNLNADYGVVIGGGAVGQAGTLYVKNSSGTTTASIDGTEGTASFAEGGLAIDQYGNITTNSSAEATLYNFNATNSVNIGIGQAGTLNVKDSGGTTTASIDGAAGTASFLGGNLVITNSPSYQIAASNLSLYIDTVFADNGLWINDGVNPNFAALEYDGTAQFKSGAITLGKNTGTVAWIDDDGSASFATGAVIIGSNTGTAAWIDGAGNAMFANGNVTIEANANVTISGGTLSASSGLYVGVAASIDYQGNLTFAGALIGGTQSLTTSGGAGAVNLTTLTTEVETTGTLDALTLANGTVGQIKVITHTVGAFTSVLTPTTALGFTTITFLASLGQTCTLEYTAAGWVILAVGGLTLPVVA